MDRGAKYSAIALGLLAVVSSAVYVSYLVSVSASPAEPDRIGLEDWQNRSAPLKAGWNSVAGGSLPISEESKIIVIGGSRIVSIAQARQMAIIGDVVVKQDNILGRDIDQIPPREEFSIYISDSNAPISIIF